MPVPTPRWRRRALSLTSLLACTGAEPPARDSVAPTAPVASGLRPSDAPVDPPCGLDLSEPEALPSATTTMWALTGGQAYASTPGQLVYTRDDPRAWAAVEVVDDRLVETKSGELGAALGGLSGRVDLSLDGTWAYAATIDVTRENTDVAVGALFEPETYVVVDPDPSFDADAVLSPSPDGGWAVAWQRGPFPTPLDIYFARLDETLQPVTVTLIEAGAKSEGLDITTTPQGYVIVYMAGYGSTVEPGLTALFVSPAGELQARIRVADVRGSWPRVARDPRGLGISYSSRAEVGFARLSFDGQHLVAPVVLSDAGKPGPTSLLFNHGQYWIGFVLSYCQEHECPLGTELRIVPVTPKGAHGEALSIASSSEWLRGPLLGVHRDGVLAAWQEGRDGAPVHQGLVRCPASAPDER